MRDFLIILLLCFVKVEAQSSALTIADSLYAIGNYTKAINFYAKESSVHSALQIARAYNVIGNLDKAILQYEDLLLRYPSQQIAQFELGKLYFKTNRFQRSADLFFDLVLDETGNPEFLYYLGRSLFELKSTKESVLNFKRAFEMDSTHLRSIFQLSKYYVSVGAKDSVLHYVNRGLDYFPNDVSLINLKALAYFNNNEYEKAIPWLEKVLELGERKKYVYEKLAFCYYKNWEFEKAVTTYQILVDMNPNNSETYFKLGEVFRKNKRLDSAEVYIKKGISIQKPMLAKGYGALGGLARERNDLKSALKYYKMAHKESPKDPMTYYQICTLVDRNYKDPKLKLEYYENYLEKYGENKSPHNLVYIKFVKKRISELKEEIHFNSD